MSGVRHGGRAAGTPNKATSEARQAIATFVDGNAWRLSIWLDKVAEGDPEHDIKPNPAKAFELFQSVVEYHIPKLARTRARTASIGNSITVRCVPRTTLTAVSTPTAARRSE